MRKALARGLLVIAAAMEITCLSEAVTVTEDRSPLVKVIPSGVSSEAAWSLFDRSIDSGFTPPNAPVVVDLDEVSELAAIKVYGPAPYGLRVTGAGGTSLGLPPIDLSHLSRGWHAFPASTPPPTRVVELHFEPAGGTGAVPEIELWGVADAPRPQVTNLSAEELPKPFTATKAHPRVDIEPGYCAAFSVTLARRPELIRRAFITYLASNVLRGFGIKRSINGLGEHGGSWLPSTGATEVVDEIDPQSLRPGANDVSLCVPDHAARRTTIDRLRIVGELDLGVDLARSISIGSSARDGAALRDTDPATTVQLAARERVLVTFDRSIAPDALLLAGQIQGAVSVACIERDGTEAPIDVRQSGEAFVLDGGARRCGQLAISVDKPSTLAELDVVGSGAAERVDWPRLVVTSAREHFGEIAWLGGFVARPRAMTTAIRVRVADDDVGTRTGDFGRLVKRGGDAAAMWRVPVTAAFPDGTSDTLDVLLDRDRRQDLVSAQASAVASSGTSASVQQLGAAGEVTAARASPLAATQIRLGTRVGVDVPAGAVAKATDITVRHLGEIAVPPLDPGMINVTGPKGHAYELLPHGQRFVRPVEVVLPYDPALIPEGMTPDDVNAYFFDPKAERWIKLPRRALDIGERITRSSTDHFTIMINAVLAVPRHPTPLSHDPTALTSIGAASPAANIDLIAEPGPGEPFRELYPSRIEYTSHPSLPAAYAVHFDLDDGTRPDRIVSGRAGFKTVTRKLLRSVRVTFRGELVRQYVLTYGHGQFDKTVLSSIRVYGTQGCTAGGHAFDLPSCPLSSLFHEHRFDYHTEDQAFSAVEPWDVVDDPDPARAVLGKGSTKGQSGHVSLSARLTDNLSASASASAGGATRQELVGMYDMNGDGLPDQVLDVGGQRVVLYNRSRPGGIPAGTADLSLDRPCNASDAEVANVSGTVLLPAGANTTTAIDLAALPVELGQLFVVRAESDLSFDPADVTLEAQAPGTPLAAYTEVCVPNPAGTNFECSTDAQVLESVPLDTRSFGVFTPIASVPPAMPYVAANAGMLEVSSFPAPGTVIGTEPFLVAARSNRQGILWVQDCTHVSCDATVDIPTLEVEAGESITFEIVTPSGDDGGSLAATLNGGPAGPIPLIARELGATSTVGTTFSGGYRGLSAGIWNDREPFAPAQLLDDLEAFSIQPEDRQRQIARSMIAPEAFPRGAEVTGNMPAWIAPRSHALVSATMLHAAPVGVVGQTGQRGGLFAADYLRVSGTRSFFLTAEAELKSIVTAGIRLSGSASRTDTTTDIIDMNGDGVADVLTPTGATLGAFTAVTTGGGAAAFDADGMPLRRREGHEYGIDFGGRAVVKKTRASGLPVSVDNDKGPDRGFLGLSAGVGLGIGRTQLTRDLVDVNGDGLPDIVSRDETTSSDGLLVQVRYNLGDRYGLPEPFGTVAAPLRAAIDGFEEHVEGLPLGFDLDSTRHALQHETTLNVHASGGFKLGDFLDLSHSIRASTTRITRQLADINGDGLPDLLFKKDGDARIRVQLNRGGDFGPATEWAIPAGWPEPPGGVFSDPASLPGEVARWLGNLLITGSDVLAGTGSQDGSSTSASIGIPLGVVTLGAGGSKSTSKDTYELSLLDIDGDSASDHVLRIGSSGSLGRIYVKRNRVTGKANLLRAVHRPLGGRVTLSYSRAGNTVKLPQSREVLARVEVDDGVDLGAAFASPNLVTTLQYEDGFYHRREKELFGFGKVTTRRADGVTVELEYENGSYALRGLLRSETRSDSLGRLLHRRVIQRDLMGNRIARIEPNHRAIGAEVRYLHDRDRLARIDYPSKPDVTFVYGAPGAASFRAGRLAEVHDETGSQEHFYGALGELRRTLRTVVDPADPSHAPKIFDTRFTTDSLGRMLRIGYPDGEQVTSTYDAAGMLAQVTGSGAGYTQTYAGELRYDVFGNRTRARSGNGVVTTWSFDPLRVRLASLVTTLPSATRVQDLRYSYDPGDNPTRIENALPPPPGNGKLPGGSNATFTYDGVDRLVRAVGRAPLSQGNTTTYDQTFAYSASHNLLHKQRVHLLINNGGNAHPPGATNFASAYAYGAARPHLPARIGDLDLVHDPSGNPITRRQIDTGSIQQLTWDDDGRLVQVSGMGANQRNVYDASGLRVIRSGRDGDTVFASPYFDLANDNVGTKHVFAGATRVASVLSAFSSGASPPAPSSPGTAFYFHLDHLGSAGVVTASDGTVNDAHAYFPDGEIWIDAGPRQPVNGYLFSGKQLDVETGLYDFGQRFYDPRLSLWLGTDPLLLDDPSRSSGSPLLLSPLAYGAHSPLRFRDPDGRDFWDVVKTVYWDLNPFTPAPYVELFRGNPSGAIAITSRRAAVAAVVINPGAAGIATGAGLEGTARYAETGSSSAAVKSAAAFAATSAAGSYFASAARAVLGKAVSSGASATAGGTAAAQPARGVPNPYGRKGGPAHQAKMGEVAADVESRGLRVGTEHKVSTPGGAKGTRYVDVVGKDAQGNVVEMHQVGRQTRGGQPVSREVKALDDIERATGTRPTFHPYNE